jgi:YggT family protein
MDSILFALGKVTLIALRMVQILVFASVLISWVGADPNNQMVQMVRSITEPLFRPFRKLTRNIPGPLDWAPMIVLLIIVFVEIVIQHALGRG